MTDAAELRTAEARRMLGLADDAEIAALPDRAAGWLDAGLASPSLELLAAGDGEPERSLRLLRAAAVELGATFATTQDARAHYIRESLPQLTTAAGAAEIPSLSNGLTDELTARARRALRRLLRRNGR